MYRETGKKLGLRSLKMMLVLGSVIFLGGCGNLNPMSWFSEDTEPPAELTEIEAELTVRIDWSVNVGNGQGDRFLQLTPAIDGGVIYAASDNGDVVAVNTANGEVIWRTRTRELISGAVGAGNGLVMYGTPTAEVVALNQDDGSELWRASVTSEVLSPPKTNGDVVVVQTVDDKLVAMDAESGQRRWIYETTLPTLTLRGTNTPVFVEDTVIAGFSNGTLISVAADNGIWNWDARVAVPEGRYDIERVIDVDGQLMVEGNTVFASSYQGNLMAFDAETGRVVWGMEASSYHGPDTGFNNIYFTNDRGHVVAVRNNSVDIAWDNDSLDRRRVTAPRTINNYVAVADFEGYLHMLSQLDGRIVGRIRVDRNGIRANPLVYNSRLFIYGNSGRLASVSFQ
ncbi:MAG: outer membrane protein assembly factor BamB [Pseudohongiellaceae bacterium]